ncbi:PREDICTED: leucine-rich repeats and immunoglobulin-like domains protein 1 [Branchiostoma belcheri]|uniref:Leucine-rich repeats and immunoglobulin-like domains protein 1 n=1 Tax=Branchiostoma belcheri TaxID=7741 RepID=A0A6P5A475_BRABE|nr:PREDICTED: leucine-rich repeats and immunoglobulin-like domains protein 1 [Branchiostoma belcheri]
MTLCCAFRWSAVVLMLTCLSGLSGADRRAACPQACNCFPGTVFCSNRRLKAVPKGIPPSGMQRLYLDGNNLTLVPARAFLNYTELTNLDLSNSFIKNMEEGAFMGLNNLRSLKVNNNNMTTLRGSIFQGLYLLKSLNLKTNKLVDIFPEVFQGLYNLEHLYVSENLVNVSTRPFRHLGNLRYLEIKENSLKTLQGYSFQDLRGLYSLDVRANDLQNLEDYAFFGLNSLRNLYLSDNNLTTLGGEVLRTITMSALSEPGSHLYQVNTPGVDLPKHLSSHTNLSHYSSNSDVEADTRSTIGLIDKD